MVRYTREKFICVAVLLSHGALAAAATAPDAAKRYERLTPARAPFTQVRVLDTVNMPIEAAGWTGWGTKTLFTGPAGEELRIL